MEISKVNLWEITWKKKRKIVEIGNEKEIIDNVKDSRDILNLYLGNPVVVVCITRVGGLFGFPFLATYALPYKMNRPNSQQCLAKNQTINKYKGR